MSRALAGDSRSAARGGSAFVRSAVVWVACALPMLTVDVAAWAQQAPSSSSWRVAPAIVTSLEGGPAVCLNADGAAAGGFKAEAFRGEATPRCENLVVFGADTREAALAFPGIVGGDRYNCKGLQLSSAHPCNSGFFTGPVEARTLDAGRLGEAIGASGAAEIAQTAIAEFRAQQAAAARQEAAARAAAANAPPPGAPAPATGGSPYGGGGVGIGGAPSSLMMPGGRPPQYLDLLRCVSVAEAMQSVVMSSGRGQERAYWSGETMRLQGQLTAMSRSLRLDDRMIGTDLMMTRPMAQQAYLGGARDGDRGTFLEVDLAYCRGRGLMR